MFRSLDPLIWIIGNPLTVASAKAVNPFRKPGAETVKQMPGFFVK